ncbi:MAG: hypothetical protein J3Q66DRAFT_35670 [Benniella sp.]|nr:MAG: hypothetical protein J3Q66DRAFT_35670 [Benniella sp.]
MLPSTSSDSPAPAVSLSSVSTVPSVPSSATATPAIPTLTDVIPDVSALDPNNPAIQAFIQAAVAHQQATEAAAAAAAAAVASANNVMDHAQKVTAASADSAVAAAVAQLASTVPGLQKLFSVATTSSAPVSISPTSVPAPSSATAPVLVSVSTVPASTTISAPVAVSVPTSAATPAVTSTIKAAETSTSSTSSSSSSSTGRSHTSSTKRFNPDDIFCLGCCRNLTIDHYTCPNTNRIFKSCSACRHKSRVNAKKVVKPPTIPTRPTISMDEFGARLKELEETQEESNLDVVVRLEGSVEMDLETLKTRGSEIATKVYESTGYWFSHSRTNDETQSKTRLKIYGCSQREDRRAPPAPKTQSRKRNRPSTKSYFPCRGNMTMTFYHNVNHVRVVYTHKRHAKYDNRKCPDYVRAFVKENLGMAPRQLYETLLENHPSMSVTQAQVRYWSHYYKKNMDLDDDLSRDETKSNSGVTDASLLAQSITSTNDGKVSSGSDHSHSSSLEGSPSHELQSPSEEEREQHERVQQLLLAQSHQVGTTLLSGSIAISVPMSESLTSSIVQSVLDESGKGLLHLPENLHAADESSAADSGRDAVVQQVTAFMKENDHQQQLLEQQQQPDSKQEESQLEPMDED